MTSVEEEKIHNLRLLKSKDEFIKIMENLNLDYPEKIGKYTAVSLFHLKMAQSCLMYLMQ